MKIEDNKHNEIMMFLDQAADHITDLRESIQVIADPAQGIEKHKYEVIHQCFLSGELESLLAAIQMRLISAVVH